MGKPLPEGIYGEMSRSAAGRGLDLARGPDPRSRNPMAGGIAESMRAVMGMDSD